MSTESESVDPSCDYGKLIGSQKKNKTLLDVVRRLQERNGELTDVNRRLQEELQQRSSEVEMLSLQRSHDAEERDCTFPYGPVPNDSPPKSQNSNDLM